MIFNIPELYKQKRALKAVRRSFRTISRQRSFPTLLALALIISGTFGGYFSLHAATSVRRAPIVFQGRISDANYVPVADTSSRNMAFRIWNHATTALIANCLWETGDSDADGATRGSSTTEGASNCSVSTPDDTKGVAITIARGVFSVALGDTSTSNNMPSLPRDFDNQSSEVYYLEVSVKNDSGTYEVLSPRIRMSAVPYAYNSDELDALDSASFLRADANTTLTQPNATSGSSPALTITGGGHTTLAISTEASDINFNLARTVQFTGSSSAGGANITNQRAVRIQAPTYSFSTVSSAQTQTIANAATLSIEGMPIAGTNAAITGSTALWITGSTTSPTAGGRLLQVSYPSATTLAASSTLIGSYLDIKNLTATSSEVYGYYVNTPIVNNSTTSNGAAYGMFVDGYQDASVRLTHSGVSGTDTWYGVRVYMPNQSTSAVTSVGLSIERPASEDSGSTYALTTNTNAGNIGLGSLTPTSYLTVTQPVITTGSPTTMTVTGGAHTALTLSTEAPDVNFNLARTVQFATGALTTQRAMLIQAPTYGFVGASTITNAATLTVLNAPKAGTNATLTNTSALWLQGDSTMTRGRFLRMGYPAGTTLTQSAGALMGLDLDLNPTSGITLTTGSNAVIGVELNMPIVAAAQAATGATHTALNIDSAEWSTTSGTNNWKGVSIDMPDITQGGTSVLTSIGVYISGGTVTSGTSYALITSSTAGNVGIGTSTPQSALQVNSGYIQFPYVSSAPAGTDCDAAAEGGRVTVYDNGGGAAQLYVCDGAAGWVVK